MGVAGEFDLDRFVTAQDDGATFDRAVTELRAGRKRTHWMWFIFPQLYGLGQSPTSRHFGIRSLAEAGAYRAHPILGPRLIACAGIVAAGPGATAVEIFGGIDAVKLHSSMSLFAQAAPDEAIFTRVLDRFFGGLPDTATLSLLRAPT